MPEALRLQGGSLLAFEALGGAVREDGWTFRSVSVGTSEQLLQRKHTVRMREEAGLLIPAGDMLFLRSSQRHRLEEA